MVKNKTKALPQDTRQYLQRMQELNRERLDRERLDRERLDRERLDEYEEEKTNASLNAAFKAIKDTHPPIKGQRSAMLAVHKRWADAREKFQRGKMAEAYTISQSIIEDLAP